MHHKTNNQERGKAKLKRKCISFYLYFTYFPVAVEIDASGGISVFVSNANCTRCIYCHQKCTFTKRLWTQSSGPPPRGGSLSPLMEKPGWFQFPGEQSGLPVGDWRGSSCLPITARAFLSPLSSCKNDPYEGIFLCTCRYVGSDQ